MLEPMILTPEAGISRIVEIVRTGQERPVMISLHHPEGNTDFKRPCMNALGKAGFVGCSVETGKVNKDLIERLGKDYVIIEDFLIPKVSNDVGGTYFPGTTLRAVVYRGFNSIEVLKNAGYNLAIEKPDGIN